MKNFDQHKHTVQFSRRKFIQSSAMASAAYLLLPANYILPPPKRIGLQIYTLRHIINEKNIPAILEKIAAIGYRELEMYGYSFEKKYWGYEPATLKKMLKAYGLKSPSAHIDFESFLSGNDPDGFKKIVNAGANLGNKYIVVGWLNEQYRKTTADYLLIAKKLNEAAQIAQQSGLHMIYHNHDFEFATLDDQNTGYDILLSHTDQQLVKMEIDLYWCVRAGVDPVKLFQQHPGRFPLWHLKDMDGPTRGFIELGDGIIDFKTIIQHAGKAGLKHFFVEQDEITGDTWQSIAKSFDYVKEKILNKF